MKRTLLVLALGGLLTVPAFAQGAAPNQVISTTEGTTPSSTPGDGKPHGHHRDGLTREEREKLHAAHDAALKANPDLDAEGKDLMAKMEAHEKNVEAAMVKADPSIAPLLAKADKDRMHHHGGPGGQDGGTPPPTDSGN
jgi:hypothetical protein